MTSHVKTIWFVFWVLSLGVGVIASSGVVGHEAWQKLVMGAAGMLGTVSTFLAAQWQAPAKPSIEQPAPADASSR